MPRGMYDRKRQHPYTDEQDQFIRDMIAIPSNSYVRVTGLFNAKFGTTLTREAILGRAHRLHIQSPNRHKAGWGNPPTPKPKAEPRDRRNYMVMRRKRAAELKPKKDLLRDENEGGSYGRGYKRATAEQVAQRRKGVLPCIVEQNPTTSKPIFETAVDACKWPTSDDVRSMEVCGAVATCGAYCDHHASLAYRVMPTRKRHAAIRAEQNEHAIRLEHVGTGVPGFPQLGQEPLVLQITHAPTHDMGSHSDVPLIPWFLPLTGGNDV